MRFRESLFPSDIMETVMVLSADAELNAAIAGNLSDYNLQVFENPRSIIDRIYNSPPSLLLAKYEESIMQFVRMLRDDPMFSNLPILILLGRDDSLSSSWHELQVDDYIRFPFSSDELAVRVGLGIYRSKRVVETNPLTMLPGNTPIIREVQARLDTGLDFALAYADLDHFKPFNDKYGFSCGDETLRMTARLITNVVKQHDPANYFVGHIGGDDFVFCTDIAKVEKICHEILDNFDCIIPTFYSSEDRESGYIISHDRAGNEKKFALLSISIGVTINRGGWFKHYGAISNAASEMKKFAKTIDGSVYKIDRRDHSGICA